MQRLRVLAKSITKTVENPEPHFAWTRYAQLPRTISLGSMSTSTAMLSTPVTSSTNVMEASHLDLGGVVAKFASFEKEVGHYEAEL